MKIQESKPQNQDSARNVPSKEKELDNETKPPAHRNLQLATFIGFGSERRKKKNRVWMIEERFLPLKNRNLRMKRKQRVSNL